MQGRHDRRGFSFTEILFAVMILGIGFIMVAAMFPVAIHQTEDTTRETIGASIGRQAYSFFSQIAGVEVTLTPLASPPQRTSLLVPTLIGTTGVGPTQPFGTILIPPGQTSVVVPGNAWSFFDIRDLYTVVPPGMPTSTFFPHRIYLWSWASKNMIQASDNRFAWVVIYKRDLVAQGLPGSTQPLTPAPYAQVIFVGTQQRAKPAYDANLAGNPLKPDDTEPTSTNSALRATFISVQLISAPGPTGNAIIQFRGATPPNVGENAYVIVSTDGATGLYNGRVYRIGEAVPGTANQYYFAPGEGPGPNDPPLTNATVFIVGRSRDPGSGAFSGLSQDVSVYTTYVQTP